MIYDIWLNFQRSKKSIFVTIDGNCAVADDGASISRKTTDVTRHCCKRRPKMAAAAAEV